MKGHFVYKYVDSHGQIEYIGKCDTYLLNRVKQHRDHKDPYHACQVYYIRVSNSSEADILETLLINKYKPRYNQAKKIRGGLSLAFSEPIWKPLSDLPDKYERRPRTKANVPDLRCRLSEVRAANDETQADIAYIIGVSTMAISQYEKNHRLPPYDKMLMIAEHYGTTVDYIFYDKNKEVNNG